MSTTKKAANAKKTSAAPTKKAQAKTATKAPAKAAAKPAKTAAPTAKKAAPTAKKAPVKAAAKAPVQAEATPALVKVGQNAPPFSVVADDGKTISLADFKGKRVVLYFYPKDNTPGCTREACSFQENLGKLAGKNAVVLGVSRDSAKSHSGFKTKYKLAFPLLVDADSALHRAYGAWGTKTMYGKTIEGALRTTVIIDEKGKIGAIFNAVKVDGHTEAVLAALDSLR